MFILPSKSTVIKDLLSQKPVTLPTPASLVETRKSWNLINPVSELINKMGLQLISSGQTYFVDGFESSTNNLFTAQDYLLTAKVLSELNEFDGITYATIKERLTAQFNLYLNSEKESKAKINDILIEMLPNFFEKNLNAIHLSLNENTFEKNNKNVVFDTNFKNIINVWLKSFDMSSHKPIFEKLLATLLQEKSLTIEDHPIFFTSSLLNQLRNFWEQNHLLRKAFAIEITPTYIWLMNGTPTNNEPNTTVLSKIQRAGALVATLHDDEILTDKLIREYANNELDITLSKQESIDSFAWLKSKHFIDQNNHTTQLINRFDFSNLN